MHRTAPKINRLQLVLRATNMSHVTLVHIADRDTGHLPQEHHRSGEDHHPQTTHVRDDSIRDLLTSRDTNAVTHDPPNARVTDAIETPRRIFPQAQAKPPALLVPYVWAATSTPSATATKALCGTEPLPLHCAASTTNWLPDPTSQQSASTGSFPGVATAPTTTNVTFALDAVKPLTELRPVIELRKHKALTPYHPDIWEKYLREANILHEHEHILAGLRLGFHLDFPDILQTQTPPNRDSIILYKTHFTKVIHNEIQTGRYIGPASKATIEALIGPFQSSPMSIIPKPGRANKYRILQNLSFPITPSPAFPNPSINSFINSHNFPTTWGTFTVTSLLLTRLPSNSEIATRDISEAYRGTPIHYTQWPSHVVRTAEDAYCIDTAIGFGARPSGGLYGDLRDTSLTILRSQGLGPINPWVDDHLFARIQHIYLNEYNKSRKLWNADIISRGGRHQTGGRAWYGGHIFDDGTLEEFIEDCRYPLLDLSKSSPRSAHDEQYTYNFADIDNLSSPLGIPWEREKDMPFARSTTYIGFVWDLATMRVSLPSKKKTKYLAAIQDWTDSKTHVLNDVEKLYGKLLHTCSIIPRGRAFLTELEAMLGLFDSNPFRPISSPKLLADNLNWWTNILLQPDLSRPIPTPTTLIDVGAFSDASSGIGIAVTISNRWRAWRLIPGWTTTLNGKRDITWAEAIGFECLVRILIPQCHDDTHFLIHGDNNGVVEGWWNNRSRNREVNQVFRRIHQLILKAPHTISFHTVYVASKLNPADAPSRGIYPSDTLLLPYVTLPSELDGLLVDSTTPYTPLELRLHREGRYPKAMEKIISNTSRRD